MNIIHSLQKAVFLISFSVSLVLTVLVLMTLRLLKFLMKPVMILIGFLIRLHIVNKDANNLFVSKKDKIKAAFYASVFRHTLKGYSGVHGVVCPVYLNTYNK